MVELLKINVFLIYCSTILKNVESDNETLEEGNSFGTISNGNIIWFSQDFVFNVTRTVIISTENKASESLTDVRESVQKYLCDNQIPFVFLETMSFLTLTQDINMTSKSLKDHIQRDLFFIIFENVMSLTKSVEQSVWLNFYKSFNTKHFVFIIAVNDVYEMCYFEEDIIYLKNQTGNFFGSIWRLAEVIEVLILIPNVCDKQYIFKYDFIKTHTHDLHSEGISVLSEEDVSKNSKSLRHDFKDFNKFPLKINAFPRVPTLVDKEMAKSFSDTYLDDDIAIIGHLAGFDGFTMSNLVKRLNFEALIKPPSDNQKYGRLENNTFTGSLGDIISKKSDISFNARFIKWYKTNAIDFTYPILSDEFCIITPKAQRIPTWMSIFLIFDMNVWISILICVFVIGVVWWFMKTRFPDREKENYEKPFYAYYLDICLLLVSNPIVLSTQYQERLFITMCLIFNLIIAGLFQGQLSTAYSTVSYYSDIKSLNDLDKSGYKIETSNDDIFGVNISKVGDRLTKKIINGTNKAIKGVAEERNYACVERKADAKLMIQRNFTNDYGENLVHIVEECPRSYHLAYIVYKGFPLLKYINEFLVKCVEAGLIDKWYYFTDFSMLLPLRIQRKDSKNSERKLSLLDVKTSFVMLGIGYSMSIIVFVLELILFFKGKDKRKDRPLFAETHNNPIIFYMSYSERLDKTKF